MKWFETQVSQNNVMLTPDQEGAPGAVSSGLVTGPGPQHPFGSSCSGDPRWVQCPSRELCPEVACMAGRAVPVLSATSSADETLSWQRPVPRRGAQNSQMHTPRRLGLGFKALTCEAEEGQGQHSRRASAVTSASL